jgi:DnaJ-domain-containing protein 1
MSEMEILVSVIGAFAGYWIISEVIDRGKPKVDKSAAGENAKPAEADSSSVLSFGDDAAPAWYQTLGVEESAPLIDIQNAYRTLISQYHPDKTAQLGPELRALAESKTKELNAAYEFACSLRK